jgi:hypothetical protein
MTSDEQTFHFPPDVFDAVVDAIPLLTRSKLDVLTFFQGCGVSQSFLQQLDQSQSKYSLTRTILKFLNEKGDSALGVRRQVLKRVTDYDTFTTCFPDNVLKAQGAVDVVRQLVNRKDSFTRLQQVHDEELNRHKEARDAEATSVASLRKMRDSAKTELFALFSEGDPQRRGLALEPVLGKLFIAESIHVRESFTVRKDDFGVIEQIDGAIDLDSRTYLVEMKWFNERLSRKDVSSSLVSVFARADVGLILISASGFHQSAIEDVKGALRDRTVILVELREIVSALELESPIADLLRAKIRSVHLEKNPLTFPLSN